MSSSVFFKFKSQREPSRVEFDGTGISVFELKRDIIIKSGLGDGTEFDLAIYNEDGNEEYDDDTTIIPRSTSVIARRLPPIKPGAGRAARYMSGKMPVSMKNSSRKEQSSSKPTAKSTTTTIPTQMNSAMTEEQRIAAMFETQNEQWSTQQEEMANQTPVFRPGGKKNQAAANVPAHDPPVGYICYRCGEKGHWIQLCPTNDDPNFDNKPRVKRTTGIPKSFLKTVEKPAALINDGTTDDTKLPSGVMVNADGDFVVAEPDKASWERFQAKTKSSAAAQEKAAAGNKELQDRGLECSIDKKIFIDPMKTPCCEKTYCNDCITNALIETDFTCPGCQSDGILIDDLKPDGETSTKIKAYLDEMTAAKREKERAEKARSKSPSVKAESTPAVEENVKSKSKSPSPKLPVQVKSPANSPLPAKSTTNPEKAPVKETSAPPTKRPADQLLENPKIPKAPKAMQQQEAQKQAMLQQQAMMNGMPAFPNMPMPFDMSQNFYGAANGGMNLNPMMNGFGMNPMMNPMMNFGGFPNSSMNMYNNGGAGGYGSGGNGNMGMMNGGGQGNHMNGAGNGNGNQHANMNGNINRGGASGVGGGFSNQQKTIFADPLPNEEDNAYFRKPVNPHRHQGRQRRTRPSDYREL
ncbi:putative RING finger protein [Lachnellula arida]|uniref:Putative RING finger protein n=1 Tax=Lachnellula arida TaxID=1316785 RepID=A0A8T9B0D2_9HELO|nr:putative RING finger protein [Lachnellula arida]